MTGFLLTFRWYPCADMLRGLATSSVVFALLLLLPAKAAFVLICLLAVPYLVFAVINVFHFVNFGSTITPYAIQSILETSIAESGEFLTDYVTLKNFLITVLVILLFGVLFKLALAANRRIKRNWVSVVAAIMIIVAFIPIVQRKKGKVLRFNVEVTFVRALYNYQAEISHINAMRELRSGLTFEGLEFLDGAPDAERNYVFIIGEGGNRNHFSLYNYWRETTPRLEAMRDELYVVEDAISAAPYTVTSLRTAFLFYDGISINDSRMLAETRSLINLFNQAGFDTYWLSNQTVNADRLTGASILAGDSKYSRFFNMADDESKTVLTDGVLLPALEEALNGSGRKKAIFLHTIGSHTSYKLRYPEEFDRYTDPDDVEVTPWRAANVRRYINEYDNSILYTDYIITEVINITAQHGGRNFVMYFSDHGQEVYDELPRRGQNSSTPSRHMYEIPVIFWLSGEYKAAEPELAGRLHESLGRPFSLAYMPATVSELGRLTHDAFEPEKSLIHPLFNPGARLIHGRDTIFPFDELLRGN